VGLKQRLDEDLKAALLAGEREKADVLRGLKAVVLNEEVAKGVRDTGLEDAAIEQLFAREVKKRAESATVYDGAGRPELALQERAEATIIEHYLPEQLSEDDILAAVTAAITELGANGPQMMGQVIGVVKSKLGNTADGSVIARIVKEQLN
jgi:uncharacterized protein